jgi:hypothetical protein
MIVNSTHQFVFIANGKTGTTSIELALSPYDQLGDVVGECRGFFYGKHVPARVLREILGHAIWNQSFKFGFVRNPWDRIVSIYHHYRNECKFDVAKVLRHPRSALYSLHRARRLGIPESTVLTAEIVQRLYDLQRENRNCMSAPSNLQYTMFFDEDEKPLVDFIGRYERLEEDARRVLRRLELDAISLPHLNKASRRRSYRDYFDDEARELVGQLYKKDIELFQYVY